MKRWILKKSHYFLKLILSNQRGTTSGSWLLDMCTFIIISIICGSIIGHWTFAKIRWKIIFSIANLNSVTSPTTMSAEFRFRNVVYRIWSTYFGIEFLVYAGIDHCLRVVNRCKDSLHFMFEDRWKKFVHRW